jgi:2-C-methyl-D-erythritol 4-phosphate cytidylyltransferase/2-C-methyl-D-erythritol 2,4-cyclodiphosphate synthase
MSKLSLILLSAGESNRFKFGVKKQWLRVANQPLWLQVLNRFRSSNRFEKIILTAHKDEVELFRNFTDSEIVVGGETRQESIKNGLAKVDTEYVVISDIARCFIPDDMLDRLIESRYMGDVVVPYLPVSDTVVVGDRTVDRDSVKLIQTPQVSKTEILKEFIQNSNQQFTDESSLFVANGYSRFFVIGDKQAEKLTYIEDIKGSSCFKDGYSEGITIGSGFDVHQLQIDGDRTLKLGGIEIDTPLSFQAHSDGDVLIHSLIDAILGGASLGDIGDMFPDNNHEYKDIDSMELLNRVYTLIHRVGVQIEHIDITVMAQTPRLKDYKLRIRENLAEALLLNMGQVNIKATTTEKLGAIGRKEGVAVLTTVTMKNIDWRVLQNEN